MALKNILVHLDNSHHSTARLKLALDLAQSHQARLTALNITTHAYYESQYVDAEANRARIQAEFNEIIAEAGVNAELLDIDWKVTGVSVTEVVNLHAHYADLVIVGQTEQGSPDRNTPADLPERVVLGSGRPVLIIPYTASYKNIGNRVLVAWKSGREATRAVNDSLPLLAKAAEVHVLVVNPADPEKNDAEKICTHLACHGIQAKAEQTTSVDISIADVLLNRASVEGSDLLVMGAYAHKRIGTLALGEVAQHILKHMTVPVLMSH
jgi:nucleotide-binding universal stress UspA family protein